MWEPLQMLGGLLILIAGVWVFRGLRGRPPRPGFLFRLGRILRRLAGVIVVLTGFFVVLEGSPWMKADICLDLTEDLVWCTDPEPFEAALDADEMTDEMTDEATDGEAGSSGAAGDGAPPDPQTAADEVSSEEY